MSPEEIKELIKVTIQEVNFRNSIILAIIPVVATTITSIVVNVIYDGVKRKKEFIKNYKLEQLKNLYLPLYSMIAQSEYIRKITELDYEEAPYIELSTKKTTVSFGTNGYSRKDVEIENGLSDFKEDRFVNLVIQNSEYATQELIKLAVAYRFLLSNRKVTNEDFKKQFESDYNKIVTKFIKLIIKETNDCLEYCNMNYSKKEKNKKLLDFNIY